MSTLLTELVRRQSAYAVLGLFNRTIDKVAEEIAHDLLLDPELRAELQQLVRVAVQQALKELNEPAPPADDLPRHRYKQLDQIDEQLKRIEQALDKEAAMIEHISMQMVRYGLLASAILVVSLLVGCPLYRVYDREMTGRAELAQASSNRQIRTLEAQAQLDAAKHLANAEIERARGVAEANRIIGDSLKGNEDYLRYLWIHNLEVAESKGTTIIYVPTEANLPILEATRVPKPQ